MILLLGSPPRVGKSIISSEIRLKHAVSVVSADTLGAVLESLLSPEAAPDLYVFAKFDEMPMAERVKLIIEDPAELIDYVRKVRRIHHNRYARPAWVPVPRAASAAPAGLLASTSEGAHAAQPC